MSKKHPIISVTGSSGAGTTSVRKSFEQIFRREKVNAAYVEGDSFHRYDRKGMQLVIEEEGSKGDAHFSHFGPEANLLEELAAVFRSYGESGRARTRHYVHDATESDLYGGAPGPFTDWKDLPGDTDVLFYGGCMALSSQTKATLLNMSISRSALCR